MPEDGLKPAMLGEIRSQEAVCQKQRQIVTSKLPYMYTHAITRNDRLDCLCIYLGFMKNMVVVVAASTVMSITQAISQKRPKIKSNWRVACALTFDSGVPHTVPTRLSDDAPALCLGRGR